MSMQWKSGEKCWDLYPEGHLNNAGVRKNNSERPVDALAEKGESLTHSLTDNLKSRDASASNKK